MSLQEKQGLDRLIVLITMLLLFGMAARIPVDSDLFWHLRSGEATIAAGRPLLRDIFSYTLVGQPWTNHSWLSQVLLYLLFHWGGYPALGVFTATLAAFSFWLVNKTMRGPMILRAFLLIFAGIVAAVVWTPRPQMFSLLFIALLAWMLYLIRMQKTVQAWWIPVLFVIWSNLHGGYPLGLFLIAAVLTGEAFDRITGSADKNTLSWKKILSLASWGLAGFGAVAINPNGIHMWTIPFQTLAVGALRQLILEWASPDFHEFAQQPFLWMFLATAVMWAFSRTRVKSADLFSFVVFAALSLFARRNMGAYAIVTVPILCEGVLNSWAVVKANRPGWLEKWFSAATNQNGTDSNIYGKGIFALNLIIIAVIAFAAFGKLAVVTLPSEIDAVIARNYPVGAVEWIKTNNPTGALFNSYNWGGYLVWQAREYPVFVDGRTDLFGDQIISQWRTVVQAQDGWEEILNRWNVRLVLMEPDRPVNQILPLKGWKLVYHDEVSSLYER